MSALFGMVAGVFLVWLFEEVQYWPHGEVATVEVAPEPSSFDRSLAEIEAEFPSLWTVQQ